MLMLSALVDVAPSPKSCTFYQTIRSQLL